MDLQIISLAQDAAEEFQNILSDIKEAVIDGNSNTKALTLQYINASNNLNTALRKARNINNEVSLAEKEFEMTRLSIKIVECGGISIKELKNYKGRKRDFVLPKQVHMAFLHKVFGAKSAMVGSIYSLDHATVLHACKTVRNLNETDSEFRRQYEDVISLCESYDERRTTEFLNCKS